ncbi:MAG: hypothetical protein EA361_06405 [Bacteroidetes bacterium]|nr:MAG: hypothetical protein EA361_06405 [Bacteroidota bacterium]
MEDFIYILLAVVWLAISILGGRKKKKQAEEQRKSQPNRTEPQPIEIETPTQEKESDFEDLLEDFFGSATPKTSEQSQSEPRPQPAPQPAYSEERRYNDGKNSENTFMSQKKDEEVERYEGTKAIDDDFEFAAEGKVETLEDLINLYQRSEQKILEEDAKIDVVDLDEEVLPVADMEFDARKAIIYSEIINRKYS